MAKHQFNICTLAATLALLAFSSAYGAETPRPGAMHRVTGEKLDSGLDKLPHYREWAHNPATRQLVAMDVATRVSGEKLDSGLGKLSHYREWAHNPETRRLLTRNGAIRVASEKPGRR